MRALKDEGVKLIFGYPGGAALHIYDAIFRQKALQHILVRHEQGATHAADGYSRATGKPGVAIVTFGFFLYSLIAKQKIFHPIAETSKAMATGILFHGIYLGGCWFSFSKGMPAGIVALIVTLQPILTSLLAGPLLGERVTWRQWIGIFLGFGGTLLVLGIDVLEAFPMIALIASCVALLAITAGTLWQKKLSMEMPLSVNNIYQSFSASIFLIFLFSLPAVSFSDLIRKT